MDTLVLPLPLLHRVLALFAERPSENLFLSVGVRRDAADCDWLGREVWPAPPAGPVFRLEPFAKPRAGDNGGLVAGVLSLGVGNHRGMVGGFVFGGAAPRRLDRLSLVGRHMPVIDLTGQPNGGANDMVSGSAHLDWSRTVGALGDARTHRTLRDLRVAVVGAGRSGALACTALVRLGVRHLTIIDPDRVEPHNVPEADLLTPRDVGRAKAVAVAEHLDRLSFGGQIVPVAAPIQAPYAIGAAKKADVLVSAADDSAARLATGLVGTAHHRVVCDIGAGIFATAGPEAGTGRRFGADVRLVMPLDGCLLCRGGLTEERGAVHNLLGLPTRPRIRGALPGGRSGSARSWNSIAVGVATRALEDLVMGRGGATTWIRLEDDGQGLRTRYPLDSGVSDDDRPGRPCQWCSQAGAGDEAV